MYESRVDKRVTHCEKSGVILVERPVVRDTVSNVLKVSFGTVRLGWGHVADNLASI